MIILIGIEVALIYFALLYAAPGPDKTVAPPAHPSGPPKVFRNLALGVLFFLVLDGAIFHSGRYTSILKPRSQAGAVATQVRAEKGRTRWANKEILLIGDSRVAEGFSSDMANEIAQGKNIAFIERAVPGSGPRTWHYFLREIDSARNRYDMIVVPLTPEDIHIVRQTNEHASDIVQMTPLLRYSDALSFASSFREWRNQARAFTACILRGTGYQSDLFDLLERPAARMRDLRSGLDPRESRLAQKRDRDLTGLVLDPGTGKVKEFPRLPERQKKRVGQMSRWLKRQTRAGRKNYTWSKQIVQSYASSQTAIVFLPLPRGPLGSLVRSKRTAEPTPDEEWLQSHATVLDSRIFEFLETPEYFSDATHLNRKGRSLFTKRLTEELLTRLQISSTGSAEADSAESSD
jgi:hypothetical protein